MTDENDKYAVYNLADGSQARIYAGAGGGGGGAVSGPGAGGGGGGAVSGPGAGSQAWVYAGAGGGEGGAVSGPGGCGGTSDAQPADETSEPPRTVWTALLLIFGGIIISLYGIVQLGEVIVIALLDWVLPLAFDLGVKLGQYVKAAAVRVRRMISNGQQQ